MATYRFYNQQFCPVFLVSFLWGVGSSGLSHRSKTAKTVPIKFILPIFLLSVFLWSLSSLFFPSSSFLVPQTCWLPLLLSSVLPQPTSSPPFSAWSLNFLSQLFPLFTKTQHFHSHFHFHFHFNFCSHFHFFRTGKLHFPKQECLTQVLLYHADDNALHCYGGNKANDNLKEIRWKRKSFGHCPQPLSFRFLWDS